MKLNSAGGLLQINVGSLHNNGNGPPTGAAPHTNSHPQSSGGPNNNNVSITGGNPWNYMMSQTPDGVPGVTSSSNLHDDTNLEAKLSLGHPDLPPDLTELKSLYPGSTDYPQLTANDPHLPQMGLVRTYNGGGGGGGGGGNNSVVFDLVTSSTTPMLNSSSSIKSELADYLLNSDIDDIAALIGSAIADSTVPSLGGPIDDCNSGVTSSTIDPWTELDAWIESACVIQTVHSSSNKLDQDNTIHTSDFHPTLQNLLQQDMNGHHQHQQQQHQQHLFHEQSKNHEHFSSSILQSRLQQPSMRQDNHNNNQRHLSSPQHQLPESTTSIYGLKVDPYTLDPGSPPFDQNGMGSNSDIQRPHTTHVSPPAVVTSTMGRYRKSFNQRKNYDGFITPGGFQGDFTQSGNGSKLSNGIKKRSKSNKLTNSAAACQSLELVDNGKEKPIHRCGICNRGFLNKSNIKVHLRTHTGEKPFKCDTCAKAFRQKAHLLKHVQIHKRKC